MRIPRHCWAPTTRLPPKGSYLCRQFLIESYNPCQLPGGQPALTSQGHSTDRRVFISHSHRDRHVATELQPVLEHYGAQTLLDQDMIQAGDQLPKRIRDGVSWCNDFLLIWSASAAASVWVGSEWNLAHQLRRRIIPYVIHGGINSSILNSIAECSRLCRVAGQKS